MRAIGSLQALLDPMMCCEGTKPTLLTMGQVRLLGASKILGSLSEIVHPTLPTGNIGVSTLPTRQYVRAYIAYVLHLFDMYWCCDNLRPGSILG